MLKISILDDQRESAFVLKSYVEKYCKDNEVPFLVQTCFDSVEFIQNYKSDIDLLFLDINMPHMNGLEVARAIRQKDDSLAIILVTNLRQYAIEGYSVNALDYVIKPMSYYTFVLKFQKAVKYLSRITNDSAIVVSCKSGLRKVIIQDIVYVEVEKKKLYIHTVSEVFEANGPLKEIEKELVKHDFFRCNYCYLVNLQYVSEIKDETIRLVKDELQLSRSRRKEFTQKVADYWRNMV